MLQELLNKKEMFKPSVDLMGVFEGMRRKIRKEFGETQFYDSNGTESSWCTYKGDTFTETVEGTFVVFMPKKDDYKLIFSVLGDKKIGLHYLEMKKKNLGNGTKMLNIILDIADEYGLEIDVFASPFLSQYAKTPLDKFTPTIIKAYDVAIERLVTYYESFGFVSTDKEMIFKMNYKSA
jgi:hypothetical protein